MQTKNSVSRGKRERGKSSQTLMNSTKTAPSTVAKHPGGRTLTTSSAFSNVRAGTDSRNLLNVKLSQSRVPPPPPPFPLRWRRTTTEAPPLRPSSRRRRRATLLSRKNGCRVSSALTEHDESAASRTPSFLASSFLLVPRRLH